MNSHEFGLIIIILLLLTSIFILCSICLLKVYKLLYGSFYTSDEIPVTVTSLQKSFNNTLDARTIQTRIKFLRKPYKRMKESHEKNMPTIVEVVTPGDSDYYGEQGLEESNEKVSVCMGKSEGCRGTNYWTNETVIVM